MCFDRATTLGQISDCHRIHCVCEINLALAVVDCGHRRAVDHDVGTNLVEGTNDQGPISDVQFRKINCHHIVRLQQRHKLRTELTPSTGYEDSHDAAFRGSHQPRLLRYHSTVFSSPSAKSC